ncbi:MAG: four-carbon acid sugar kinase family protein [Candidatus Izemoplasmatales bacterium]|nr:four-carbon acid sugar kinase family protein [Candidatus Izemoplasmatales bacterium]
MLKTLFICDDSTGANASAILLNKLKLRTLSAINQCDLPDYSGYDSLAVSTDSRAVEAGVAKRRVLDVLKQFEEEEILVLNKRVDSTLRGNLGSELNAFKEVFPNRKIAIVPAFPKSCRVCINGQIYVNGVSLEKTDVAKDPKMPIDTSDAYTLFKKQFKGSLVNIYKDSYVDKFVLSKKIAKAYEKNDGIIFDAETNEDIALISRVLVSIGCDVITVDPGVFTFYYTREKIKTGVSEEKFLYLVGSVTDTTFNQLKYVRGKNTIKVIALNPLDLLEEKKLDYISKDVLNKIVNSTHNHIAISTFDIDKRVVLDLFEIARKKNIEVDEVSKIINLSLAKIAKYILNNHKVKGVFSSGGDTTLSFLLDNVAKGIELIDEVMPLCVYGKIVEGNFAGLPIITKGGMIGNEDAYLLISEYFEGEM